MDDQRIDKWLWCARLFKTRGLASDAIKAGRVTLNGGCAKPARTVRVGDELVVRKPPYEFALVVNGLNKQRVAAALVDTLYRETKSSLERRTSLAASMKHAAAGDGVHGRKPTRKERHERDRLKRSF